jgi:hypothetical protein
MPACWHLELACGELVEAAGRLGRRRSGAGELLDQAPGDRRRQKRLALGDHADAGQLGHADVHEHDVGLEVVGHHHRLGAVRRPKGLDWAYE